MPAAGAVAVTGVGVSCSVAADYKALCDLMAKPACKLAAIPYGEAPRGKYAFAANFDAFPADEPARCAVMAAHVCREAAGMDSLFNQARRRTGVIVATCWGDVEDLERQYDDFNRIYGEEGKTRPLKSLQAALTTYPFGSIADHVANALGLFGPRGAISNACASGNIATGVARDWLLAGQCDAMAVIGVERFSLSGVWGAERSGFVGRALKPFDENRDGTVLGEGAACLLLRRIEDAAKPKAYIDAWAMTCEEGADIITLKEDGAAIERAMRLALERAGRRPEEVGLVSAHAPGTIAIDALETKAISRIWPAATPHVNAMKSMTGHMSGASAVTEAAACIAQMETSVRHGNHGLETQDPMIPLTVAPPQSVHASTDVVLSNACGGGGVNTSITISSPRARRSRQPLPQSGDVRIVITALDYLKAPAVMPSAPDSDWYDVDEWFAPEEKVGYMNRSGQLGAIAGIKAIDASGLLRGDAGVAASTAIISGSWIAGWPTASVAFCEGLRKTPIEIYPSTAFDNGCHLGSIIISRRYAITGMTTTYCGDLASGGLALMGAANSVKVGYVKAAVALSYDVTHENVARVAAAESDCTLLRAFGDGAAAAVLEPRDAAFARGARILGEIADAYAFSDAVQQGAYAAVCAKDIAGRFERCDIERVVVSASPDPALETLGALVAKHMDADLQIEDDSFHCGAAQMMSRMARALPARHGVLFITGAAQGAKIAVAVTSPSSR